MRKTGRRTCVIYALCDPRFRGAKGVRYVGKSYDAEYRLLQHINGAIKSPRKTRKHLWILELQALGLKPRIKILEKIENGKGWDEKEVYWIQFYEKRGADLTNIAPGGGAWHPGHWHHTVRSRQRISEGHKGLLFTEERRKHISEALIGKKRPNISKAKKGKKVPNVSLAMKKLWAETDQSTRLANMSKSQKGRTPWNKGLSGYKIKRSKNASQK